MLLSTANNQLIIQGHRKQISVGPADQNLRNMTSCQIIVVTSFMGVAGRRKSSGYNQANLTV